MATTQQLTAYASPTTLIDSTSGAASSTSLYALTTTSYAYSAEFDNSVSLYTLADLELVLQAAVTSVAPAFLTVFLLPSPSGNYTASSGNPGQGYTVPSWYGPGGSVQYLQVRGIELPPTKFKIVIQNNLGVTLPSAVGSTLKLYPYNYQQV